MKRAQKLDRLFNPSSLAMVGASRDERKTGAHLLKRLISSGFKGKLYPVNPNESEIMGLRNYHSVLDIPGEVDLAYVTVPARTVPQVMAECGQKGVGFAVVHSAGFAELGAEGKELQEEMVRFARQGGTRVIGPNCMGIFLPRAGINTIVSWGVPDDEPGPVAFVGQSGWVTENMIVRGYERGLRFSKVVSIGNQSDLTIEDLLEDFASDADTKVIGLYIEGIKRGKEFLRLARQISRKKPIIVWKGGRSEVGVRATASHTGSLAGSSVVFDAALTQAGIAIAQNLDELIDLTVGFTCPFLPRGNNVGLLVETGGTAVAGADAASALGLAVPALSTETQKALADLLKGVVPPFSAAANPVDIVWPPWNARVELFMGCARIMFREVDAMVLADYATYDEHSAKEVTRVRDEAGKPIFIVPAYSSLQRAGMSLLTKSGVPTFAIPERALKALSAMVRYSSYRQQS